MTASFRAADHRPPHLTEPNVVSPVLVLATLGIGFGTRFLRDAPHLSTFPGLAIMLTVLGFNLLGEDLLDPRSRQR